MKVILFKSKRCSVCKVVEEKLKGRISFETVDVDENPLEAGQRLVFSVPTIIVTEGEREIMRWSGCFSVEAVLRKVEEEQWR